MRQPHDDREEEHLEAEQRDDEHEETRRLALRGDDQEGDEDPDQGEDDAVEHGVLDHEAGRDGDGLRVLDAPEGGAPEERRRPEWGAACRVVDEEPDGDDGRPDEPGDDAFAEVTRGGGHGRPPCRTVPSLT